jgi:hypothetical protein
MTVLRDWTLRIANAMFVSVMRAAGIVVLTFAKK